MSLVPTQQTHVLTEYTKPRRDTSWLVSRVRSQTIISSLAQCWNVSTLLPLLESTLLRLLRDRERRDEFAALWALGLKVPVTLAALRIVLF